MNIGIIGSGGMGRTLADKLALLGHTVTITNSRGPASLAQFAKDIGVLSGTTQDAITNQDAIIISIPQKNIPDLPMHLLVTLPADVIIIETGNYYPNLRDGTIHSLEHSGIDSLWVQQQIGRRVVKMFNSILAESLRDKGIAKGQQGRIALAMSGDDDFSKMKVSSLVDALGFDTFDIGTITHSWKQQPGSIIYCRDITLDEMKKRVEILNKNEAESFDKILMQRTADEKLMASDYNLYLQGLT